MKTLVSRLFAVFVLFTAVAFAQTQVAAVSQGTSISVSNDALRVTNSPITAVVVNGSQTTGTLGTISVLTGILDTGNYQTGGTFSQGGLVVIDAPGYIDYVGNFTSATWSEFTLANGDHYYELSGPLASTEGAGSLICDTDVLKKGKTFDTKEALASCSFGSILN